MNDYSLLCTLLVASAVLITLDMLYMVSRVQKPREPIKGYEAVITLVQYGGIIAVIVVAFVTIATL